MYALSLCAHADWTFLQSFPPNFWMPLLLTEFCPSLSASTTFGGSNPGLQAEVIHSIRDHLSLMCGCSLTAHPSCFASISVSYILHSKFAIA